VWLLHHILHHHRVHLRLRLTLIYESTREIRISLLTHLFLNLHILLHHHLLEHRILHHLGVHVHHLGVAALLGGGFLVNFFVVKFLGVEVHDGSFWTRIRELHCGLGVFREGDGTQVVLDLHEVTGDVVAIAYFVNYFSLEFIQFIEFFSLSEIKHTYFSLSSIKLLRKSSRPSMNF